MELLKEYWTILAGFFAAVVWAVRVEAGMKANQTEIKALWRQRNEDLEAAKSAREETNKLLSEIRQDIKVLMARQP